MKRIQLFIAALAATVTLMAQTLNVQVGQVTYQFPAAQAGEMVYADGTTLTILNKVFTLSEVTRMYVDTTTVTDNSVSVVYQDTCALVRVAGNVAQYVDVAVDGAHVDIAQLDALATEVTYTLSGSSSDGAFLMSGSYKATVALNGLTLTNPNGAPVNIQNGKRIEVSIKSGTVNTLTDGTGNTQKGCFVSKGHGGGEGECPECQNLFHLCCSLLLGFLVEDALVQDLAFFVGTESFFELLVFVLGDFVFGFCYGEAQVEFALFGEGFGFFFFTVVF